MKAIPCIIVLILLCSSYASANRSLPVDNGRVTSGIGWRIDPFGSGRMIYHRGFDIAVPEGTRVYPVQEGTVLFAGSYRGYGNLVVVDHGNGYVTLYGHNATLMVSSGQRVDSRTVVALSGNTGRSTGPHVHYELGQVKNYLGRWPAMLKKDLEPGAGDERIELVGGLEIGGAEGETVFSLPPDPDELSDLISLKPGH